MNDVTLLVMFGLIIALLAVLNFVTAMHLHRLKRLESRYRYHKISNKRNFLYIVKFLKRVTDLAKNDAMTVSYNVLMDELSNEEKSLQDLT